MKRSPTEGTPSGNQALVYQLKITLQDLRPAVWRRVLVPADSTLVGLHRAIQAAMGWEDYHLWRFEIGGEEYGEDQEDGWGEPFEDARRTRLIDVAAPGDVLLYEYDFGDSWEHRVRVEKVLPAEPGREYPVCVAAERACPPEDCGGVGGYEHLLEVLADTADPEHEEMLEWVGGEFDPERVDPGEINQRLALTRPRQSSGGSAPAPAGGRGAVEEEGAGRSFHNPAEAAMREVRGILESTLAANPDAGVDELNAALRAASAGYNARPQGALGGLSPDQVRRLLDADWEGKGSVVRLEPDLSLTAVEGSRTFHDARALLDFLGDAGETKATAKGNLPRAAVAVLRERMARPPWFRAELHDPRKMVNEEDDALVHRTRILLELAGLVKRRKGVFSLTRAGERLREDARAGELFAILFRTHFRVLNLALLDGVGSAPSFQHSIAFPLFRFGQVAEVWRRPQELKADLVLPPVRMEVPAESWGDPLDILLEQRFLRPLQGFGLAEAEELPREPGSWRNLFRYRKSGLFHRFLAFDFDRE